MIASVIDPETGLEWEAITPNYTMTWKQAIEYATKLNLHGWCDWRIPTKEELITLYEHVLFPGASCMYWSSSSCRRHRNRVRCVARCGSECESIEAHHYVRCVRVEYRRKNE